MSGALPASSSEPRRPLVTERGRPSRNPAVRRRLAWLFAACLVVSLLALGLWREPLLRGAARWLDVGEVPRPTDAALLLAGDLHSRPYLLAELMRRGLAREALLTNVPAGSALEGQPLLHEVSAAILQRAGVDAARVTLLPPPVDTTADEISALGKYLREHPGRSVSVVTWDCHSRRARLAVHAFLPPEDAARVVMVTAPPAHFSADNWWRSEAGFAMVLQEAAKLAGYWFLYGDGLRAVALGLGLGLALALALVLGGLRAARRHRSEPSSGSG